jgi:hypothetical protein
MGTSSSYGGPKGKNPLLPDDFNDDESTSPDNQDNSQDQSPESIDQTPTELWKNAKTQISKLIGGSVKNTGSTLSAYVKAHGGARQASASAKAGKTTTVKLGGFLSSMSSQGFNNTLTEYGIDFEGRSAEEVLSDLINKIAPSPNTKEDAVARNALLDAMEILYEEIAESDNDLNVLDNMDKDKFNDVMNTYISSYIFQRFLSELESRFEEHATNTGSALNIENNIKEYISGVVDNKLKDQNLSRLDYSADTVNRIISEIYTNCYDVIEGALL